MSKRPIYYDTETTGTNPETDRIVEIAAYDPERDLSFEYLVNPGIPIPPGVIAIHGITDALVEKAPPFSEVAVAFREFCGEDSILIAHNNDQFDKHFLIHEAKRHGIKFPDWQMVDSLKWARKYRPDLPKHSLQFLRQIYGIAENQAHRALDDVLVLYQVFSVMIDDLPCETVFSLLEGQQKNVQGGVSVMPFGKHQGKPLDQVPSSYVIWLKGQGAFDKPDNATLKKAFEELGILT